MEGIKKYNIGFIILISILVIADLIIKFWIINELEVGEEIMFIEDFFSITPAPNVRMVLGSKWGHILVDSIKVIIQFLVLLVSIKIQKLEVHKLYKYSTIMIIFGWIGNHLDFVFFSRGNWSYIHMEYIYFSPTGFVFSLSSVIILFGWMLLFIALIAGSKDLKVIFSKRGSK